MIKKVYSVAVVVSDGKKARAWYTKKLGFKLVENYDHWITVAPKGSKTLLHLCESDRLEFGNTGIGFETDSVDKSYKELSKKGVEFTRKPEDEGWGKSAMFKDLDGNVFWLFE
jgi:catechol 2,3-dioxygenase-like lactoylglutathione lyase family enzyme